MLSLNWRVSYGVSSRESTHLKWQQSAGKSTTKTFYQHYQKICLIINTNCFLQIFEEFNYLNRTNNSHFSFQVVEKQYGKSCSPYSFFSRILIKCNTPSQTSINKCMKSLDVLLFVLPHNNEKICKVGITKAKQQFGKVKVISVLCNL